MKVLIVEHQIGLIGRDGLITFRTRFGLFLSEAVNTVRLVLFVTINALTNKCIRAQSAHQTVVVVLTTLECDHCFQDRLGTFAASSCGCNLVLFVAIFAQSLALIAKNTHSLVKGYLTSFLSLLEFRVRQNATSPVWTSLDFPGL